VSAFLYPGLLGVAILLYGIPGCMAPPDVPAEDGARKNACERLVIAHHMNAATPAKAGGHNSLAHGSNTPIFLEDWSEFGGRLRDMSLTTLYDFPHSKSVEEQIAWEIKVAQRAGIDAFAFYGALLQHESRVLQYMDAARETGFKITLCQSGGERGADYEKAAQALKNLVEKDKTMDALLRVDGKLLLLTYGGNWGDTVEEMVAKRHDLERLVGTPMLVMYMPGPVTSAGPDLHRPERWPEVYAAERERLGKLLEGGFDGLSPFLVVAGERAAVDCRFWMELCREYGKLYYQPVALQFHSPRYMTHPPVGDSIWNRSWNIADDGASGVQLITWNDWGETTAMAPGIGVNYGLHTLLRQAAERFKDGHQQITGENAWVFYYRYPSTAVPRLYPQRVLHRETQEPRQFRSPDHDYIWVRTELKAPATVVCQGRGRKEVAAGVQVTAFPLTPGPVRIELQRGGETIKTLSPAEVVTDQPWRVDHSLVVHGSDEDERDLRSQDFPGKEPRYYSEYGDDDQDGLLNWFEGLYFNVLEEPATPVTGQDNFNGMTCMEAQDKMVSPLQRDTPVELETPVEINVTSGANQLVGAVWRQRYHWNTAGLRHQADGLAVFNPEDQNTREIYAFHDTVPNQTYGPDSFYGDARVSADMRFNFGQKPVNEWGHPAFALLSRVAPQRQAMVWFKIAVSGPDVAKLTLGWSKREKWAPARDETLAEKTIPIPADGEFRLVFSTDTMTDDTIRLTGVCHWADGSNLQTLTAEHAVKESGIGPAGEIGLSATLHEWEDTPETPNHILLRTLEIGGQANEE
jgi:hypothetical protein